MACLNLFSSINHLNSWFHSICPTCHGKKRALLFPPGIASPCSSDTAQHSVHPFSSSSSILEVMSNTFLSHCIYDIFFAFFSYCTFISSTHSDACTVAWQKSHLLLSGPCKSRLWQGLPYCFSSQHHLWALTTVTSEISSCSKLKANSHEGIIHSSFVTFLTVMPSYLSVVQLQWDHLLWNVWKSFPLAARCLLESLFFLMAALRYAL